MESMKCLQLIPFIVLSTAVPKVGYSEGLDRVRCSVLSFTPDTHGVGQILVGQLMVKLSKKRGFEVIERTLLGPIINELKINSDGLITDEGRAKFGQLKDVRYLIYGSISAVRSENKPYSDKYGSHDNRTTEVAAIIRMTNVETGEVSTESISKESSKDSEDEGQREAVSKISDAYANTVSEMVRVKDAKMIDIDAKENTIRINEGLLDNVRKNDVFQFGWEEERGLLNGDVRKVFNRLCYGQVEVTEDHEAVLVAGTIGRGTFNDFVFRRRDSLLTVLHKAYGETKGQLLVRIYRRSN